MSLIKTNFEMPRGNDPVKQAQRLAMDLTSNFKAISNKLSTITSNSSTYGLDGVVVSSSWAATAGFTTIYTLAHGIGAIPSGYFIIDNQVSRPAYYSSDTLYISRDSWDSTNIVIRLTTNFNFGDSCSGSFKILVLR